MEAERTATPRPRTPRIVLKVADPQKFRAHYLRDLADGGVFVKTEKLLPEAAVVDVELHPPGGEGPLPLHGRVDRRVEPGGPNPAGMHVAFEGLDDDVKRRLVAVVAKFGPEAAEGRPLPNGALGEERPLPVPVLAAEPWPLPPPSSSPWDEAVPRVSVPVAADRDDAIREVAELRGRLAAAEATIGSLRAELAAHEEDEAGTRELAERLALQKNKLERLRKKESAEAAAELDRLRRELAGRVTALTETEARAARAEALAKEEHAGRADAEARAAEWKHRREETALALAAAEALAEKLRGRIEEAEKLALEAEERAERLEARLKTVEGELAAAREAGTEHERREATLARELQAMAEASGQAEAKAEGLAAELARSEAGRSEATARAEELAKRLDGARDTHAAERERLLAELAAATARAEGAEASRLRVEEKLRHAEERLGATSARVADLEGRLGAAEERLGRARTKEKDLRRLLAVVSSKVADETAERSEEGGEESGPRPAVDRSPEPAKAAAAAPVLAPRAADRRGVIVAADLLAEAGMAVEAPAADTEIPVDFDLEDPPASGVGFAEFVERLEGGSRVRRTEAYRRFKPTEPSEIRLGGWLVQADTLDTLRDLAGAKLPADRLHRLLFDFYRRDLVALVD